MSDECSLALRQAAQTRTDFAAIESELEVIQAQLARLPTPGELAKTALVIIVTTAAPVIFLAPMRTWRSLSRSLS